MAALHILRTPRRHYYVPGLLMHEHIQFFNERSIHRLLAECGLEVMLLELITMDFGWAHYQVLSCVASLAHDHLQNIGR